MPITCHKCGSAVARNTDSNNVIMCNTPSCGSIYHTKCVNIHQNNYNAIKTSWICSKCENLSNNTELSDIIAKFSDLKNDLKSVKDAVGKVESKIEDVLKLGEAVLVNKKDIQTLKAENIALKKDVERLDALSR